MGRGHVAPGGVFVIGFQLGRGYELEEFDEHCADAGLSLLGDKSLLFSEAGDAFLMYGVQGRSWIAFSDPVGPPERIRDRAQRWLAAGKKGHVGSMLIGSGQPKALEMMAVRLAVPKLTAEDLAAMERLVEAMAARAELGDVQGFFEANTEFHQRFFEVAENRVLAELYRQLRGQIDRHRLRSLELRGELRRSIDEHRAILWAARTGDVERAVRLTSDHIRVPQIRLLVEDHELASADGRPR
jgi:hypothetical protein